MALAKQIKVKETEKELKILLRKQPIHLKNRIQMLLVLKKSEVSLSKESLAKILKINHNTAQEWRTKYTKGGVEGLLSDGRVGFKPSVISTELHLAIGETAFSKRCFHFLCRSHPVDHRELYAGGRELSDDKQLREAKIRCQDKGGPEKPRQER